MPVESRYSSALRATRLGSLWYQSPLIGSLMKQFKTSVLCSKKGSSKVTEGSGMSNISDSSMVWNPRMDEPSNPKPSSKDSSVR